LERERILMRDSGLLQLFQAYLPGTPPELSTDPTTLPYFITTDALFQAYAWCLRESVEQIEETFALDLEFTTQQVMVQLPKARAMLHGPDTLEQSALDQASFVFGVLSRIFDHPLPELPASVRMEIDSQYERIKLARGSSPLPRLEPNSPPLQHLDYSVFKPISHYSPSSEHTRYFRAVRWLQLFPFIASSDRDMLALSMIRLSMFMADHQNPVPASKIQDSWDQRDRIWESIIGPAAASHPDLDRTIYIDEAQHPIYLTSSSLIAEMRKELHSQEPYIRSSTITSTGSATDDKTIIAFLIPGYATLDQVLLESLSKAAGQNYLPDSITIPAWLGSAYAIDLLKPSDQAKRFFQSHTWKPEKTTDRSSIHSQCLELTSLLLEPPSPDAPAFMHTRAWQAKSCQTAAVSWTLCRHIFALQTRPQYAVGAGITDWPGFVEPVPDYFSKLANLAATTNHSLSLVDTTRHSKRKAIRTLKKLAAAIVSTYPPSNAPPSTQPKSFNPEASLLQGLSSNDINDLASTGMELIETIRDSNPSLPLPSFDYFDESSQLHLLAKPLLQAADDIHADIADSRHPVSREFANRLVSKKTLPFHSIETLCLRLSTLAHKQLRGLPPTPDEAEWIRFFGVRLSSFSDSIVHDPRDDTPKCVRIFTNPNINKALTAGVGRPAYLYVLYPWKGRDILCRGAVLPYLERQDMQTYTDSEWKNSLIHPDKAPAAPSWIAPLLAPE
jgi:hypothetical protein